VISVKLRVSYYERLLYTEQDKMIKIKTVSDSTNTTACFPNYCNLTRFFACPLFREFREPGKFAKITGRENFNIVAFQCSRKQKRQNYGVQNNYIDSNAKKLRVLQYACHGSITGPCTWLT